MHPLTEIVAQADVAVVDDPPAWVSAQVVLRGLNCGEVNSEDIAAVRTGPEYVEALRVARASTREQQEFLLEERVRAAQAMVLTGLVNIGSRRPIDLDSMTLSEMTKSMSRFARMARDLGDVLGQIRRPPTSPHAPSMAMTGDSDEEFVRRAAANH